jgi:hypothetical protein
MVSMEGTEDNQGLVPGYMYKAEVTFHGQRKFRLKRESGSHFPAPKSFSMAVAPLHILEYPELQDLLPYIGYCIIDNSVNTFLRSLTLI